MSGLIVEPKVNTSVGAALSAKTGQTNLLDTVRVQMANGCDFLQIRRNWASVDTLGVVDINMDPMTEAMRFFRTSLNLTSMMLNPVTTSVRAMPSDLSALDFDNATVVARYEAMLESFHSLREFRKLNHFIIGNEVDSYLSANLGEVTDYILFFDHVADTLRALVPGIEVGVCFQYDKLVSHPQIFKAFAPYLDFAAFTYFPVSGDYQVRAISEVARDLAFLDRIAGDLRWGLNEAGYPSSASNASSQALQQQFVDELFEELATYRTAGRLLYLNYFIMYDITQATAQALADQQGGGSANFLAFLQSLGLRTLADVGKLAWESFVPETQAWVTQ